MDQPTYLELKIKALRAAGVVGSDGELATYRFRTILDNEGLLVQDLRPVVVKLAGVLNALSEKTAYATADNSEEMANTALPFARVEYTRRVAVLAELCQRQEAVDQVAPGAEVGEQATYFNSAGVDVHINTRLLTDAIEARRVELNELEQAIGAVEPVVEGINEQRRLRNALRAVFAQVPALKNLNDDQMADLDELCGAGLASEQIVALHGLV